MSRRSSLCLTAVIAAAAIGGCGEDEPTASTQPAEQKAAAPVAATLPAAEIEQKLGPVPKPKERYRIGVIEKTLINEHWQEMKRGYEAAAQKYGVEVTVQAAKDETDLGGQLALGDTMLQQDYDAFSISPVSPTNMQPFLDRAAAKKIPVINVDDSKVESRVFVGSNHEQMGQIAAQHFGEELPDGAKVAQVEGQAGSPAAIQRTEGFKTEAEKQGLEVVASVPGDWDRQKSLDVARTILRGNPDVQAIYANNDTMALGVIEALRAAKEEDVLVIGTDGVPDAVDSIRDGRMTGTVASFPYQMGYTAVEAAIRLLEGQGVPNTIVSRQELVTSENVEQAFAQ